ncbi:ABC transporter substrate-binding protein [Nannocystis pusilla]|uniref:ABC transporter substrate-binding protein n=1 Tax=Nannocystis pusilla TaxID=889268 RepID=UPI003BEFDAD3
MRSPRIACLVPAATDLAAALGLDVVGVSHECDHPIARGLPVLTRSRIAAMHPHGPGPADIDRQVSAAVAAGEPLYVVDRAALARLAPDIVLSQAICDVCAARADRCDLPAGARLVELAATSLAGLADDVRAVAAAAGVPERGEACLADIAAHHAALVRPRDRPRTLALEWGHPPFLGGHWVPELVALAGGEHLLSGTGQPSRRADWAEITAADPDIVVFMPCGYDLAAAAAEAEALCRSSPLGQLRCVREGRLWAVDAVRLFSRCTPHSVIHGAAVLAALLRGDEPPIAQACRIESTPALS